MGTQSPLTTGTGKPCPVIPTTSIPTEAFDRNFALLMSAQRLVLAIHRMGDKREPEHIVAWEAFVTLNRACDELGLLAGYDTDERAPE